MCAWSTLIYRCRARVRAHHGVRYEAATRDRKTDTAEMRRQDPRRASLPTQSDTREVQVPEPRCLLDRAKDARGQGNVGAELAVPIDQVLAGPSQVLRPTPATMAARGWTMRELQDLGDWLRYASADAQRQQYPAVRHALQKLVAYGKAHLLAEVELLAVNPLMVSDDGITRTVTVMQSIRYGYNRRDKAFFANLREENGGWRHVPESDPNVVIFDTFLPHRVWRRRIRYTLQASLHDTLLRMVKQDVIYLHNDHWHRLVRLCQEIVDRAWSGLGMRGRLIAKLPTKQVRRRVRDLLGIDAQVLALARAARFRGSQHAIEQKWLSFVWQHYDILSRIRRQTPTLLRPVAQYMFQYPWNPAEDPTRACVRNMIVNGMSKRSYRLLAKHADRPFREVLRRFSTGYALDALVLALSLAETGHDAEVPRPWFYRVTFDEFGRSMSPAAIRNRLAVVPQRVFGEARRRLARAPGHDELHEVALAYRGIVNWFVTCEPEGQEAANWQRWLELAAEAEARHRASIDTTTWPCAIEELWMPEGEVLALTTPLALFEEGRALRHCVYSYIGKCEGGQVRLFAARLQHRGRQERATIGLRHEADGWKLWDIRGACNRRMGGHWIALARQVAEAYARKAGSTQLPLPVSWTLGGRATTLLN